MYLSACLCPDSNFETHTHPFNSPLSRATWVSRYQKGKTNLAFTEARDSEWQWHQLGHRLCKSAPRSRQKPRQHPPLSFTGRMPFLPPNQQRQSTEGTTVTLKANDILLRYKSGQAGQGHRSWFMVTAENVFRSDVCCYTWPLADVL